MQPAEEGLPLYIAELLGLAEDEHGSMSADVRWYYRPQELELSDGLAAEDRELFKSDERGTHPVNSVAGRAQVLSPSSYWLHCAADADLTDVWMCYRHYDTNTHRIRSLDATEGTATGLGPGELAPAWLSAPLASGALLAGSKRALESPEGGTVHLDNALDARPTTNVGGKLMQRGGPDTAASLAEALLALEGEVPDTLAATAWKPARTAWRRRAGSAKTIRDLADCLAELEAGMGLSYPPDTELAQSGALGAWRARMRSLHTYPTLAAALATFARAARSAITQQPRVAADARAAAQAAGLLPAAKRQRVAPARKHNASPAPSTQQAVRSGIKAAAGVQGRGTTAAPRGGASKDGSPHGRWSKERYNTAQASLVSILHGMNANGPASAVLRPTLRDEARKAIGDTGLLDHLLKHATDAVVTEEGHRLRRRHNRDGHMEYWLASPSAVDADEEMLEEEAGHLAAEVARMRAVRTALAAATADAEAALATAQPGGALHPLAGQGGCGGGGIERRLAMLEEESHGRHEGMASSLLSLRAVVMQQAAALEALRQEVVMLRQPMPWPFPLPSPPLLLNQAVHPQLPQITLPEPPVQQQQIEHPTPQQPPRQSTQGPHAKQHLQQFTLQLQPPRLSSPLLPRSSSGKLRMPGTGAVEPETPRLQLRPKGFGTPRPQQSPLPLQWADIGTCGPAAPWSSKSIPQQLLASGPLGLKSPFAAVQQALAGRAASRRSPPPDGASQTPPPQGFRAWRPAPSTAGQGAEGCRTAAGGNTITTGMCMSGAPAPGGQTPADSALATAATLAQGIPPTTAPQAAQTAEPPAAAAHMAAEGAGAARPDAAEPASVFPAASLRLPSAELHSVTGLSGGAHEVSAMEAPLRMPETGHVSSAAAAACGPNDSAETITGDCSERRRLCGDSSSSEEPPAAQPPADNSGQRHSSGISSAGGSGSKPACKDGMCSGSHGCGTPPSNSSNEPEASQAPQALCTGSSRPYNMLQALRNHLQGSVPLKNPDKARDCADSQRGSNRGAQAGEAAQQQGLQPDKHVAPAAQPSSGLVQAASSGRYSCPASAAALTGCSTEPAGGSLAAGRAGGAEGRAAAGSGGGSSPAAAADAQHSGTTSGIFDGLLDLEDNWAL